MKKLTILSILLLSVCYGTIINVPDEYPAIQDGIDASVDGDTVLVQPGTYTEWFSTQNEWGDEIKYSINFKGKNILVTSLLLYYPDSISIIENTIIETWVQCPVLFNSGEELTAILKGFILKELSLDSYYPSSCICIEDSSPTLTDLIISNNSSYYNGTGIFISNGFPIIQNSLIVDNFVQNLGGGIFIENATEESRKIKLINVTIANNIRYLGFDQYQSDGITLGYANDDIAGGNIEIINCIIKDDIHWSGEENEISITYSNISGGWEGEGNIDSDPLFCDHGNGDYRYALNSPFVGSGLNGANMGAFGIGCGIVPVEINNINDQIINEDDSLTISLSGVGGYITYSAFSDTNGVITEVSDDLLKLLPIPNWNGNSIITVIASEGELSDSTTFLLEVFSINDPQEDFYTIYPTIENTFSTHIDSNEEIQFIWEKSQDVDSDILYHLYLELEFFGQIYSSEYLSISDTTYGISASTLDPLLTGLNLDEQTLEWYVISTDGNYDPTIGDGNCESEVCVDNDSLVSFNCEWTISTFSCSTVFNGVLVSDACPVSCNTCPEDDNLESVCENYTVISDTSQFVLTKTLLGFDNNIIPINYTLSSYPNPFNPTTTIAFSIPELGLTTITTYDITGRELKTLTNEVLSVGNYSINWNASSYPSGVYLIRMDSGDFTQTQKVVLVK